MRRAVRNNVFFKRKNLKNTPVSISDHLTLTDREIMNDAKNAFGREHVWSSLNKVFVNIDNTRHELKSKDDVKRLQTSDVEAPAQSHTSTPEQNPGTNSDLPPHNSNSFSPPEHYNFSPPEFNVTWPKQRQNGRGNYGNRQRGRGGGSKYPPRKENLRYSDRYSYNNNRY